MNIDKLTPAKWLDMTVDERMETWRATATDQGARQKLNKVRDVETEVT